MTAYDQVQLRELVDALFFRRSTSAVGQRLQDLTVFLIEPLHGIEAVDANKFNIGRTSEYDIWLHHVRDSAGMPFDYGQVPVECKNEADKTGPNDVAWFGEKIRYSGARDGLLVTVAGLSGEKQSGAVSRSEKSSRRERA